MEKFGELVSIMTVLGNGTYDSSPFPVQMINQDGTPFNEVVALSGGTERHPFSKGWYGLRCGKIITAVRDGTTTSRNHPVQVTKSDGQLNQCEIDRFRSLFFCLLLGRRDHLVGRQKRFWSTGRWYHHERSGQFN